jgi:hypothetical protein
MQFLLLEDFFFQTLFDTGPKNIGEAYSALDCDKMDEILSSGSAITRAQALYILATQLLALKKWIYTASIFIIMPCILLQI